MKEKIQAKVIAMPVIALSIQYAIEILGPVYMAPRFYSITLSQLMAKSSNKDAILDLLRERIIHNYNEFVEHSPLLDMSDDPDRYKNLYEVEFTDLEWFK